MRLPDLLEPLSALQSWHIIIVVVIVVRIVVVVVITAIYIIIGKVECSAHSRLRVCVLG